MKLSEYPVAANLIGATVPIVQGGGNAMAPASLFATTDDSFNALDYGAIVAASESAADANAATIQAAINAANAAGGGRVLLPAGVIWIGATLTVYNLVALHGCGMGVTSLKAKTNLNAAIIQSYQYAALTGQNKWLVSAGMVHGIEFHDLQIDGNRTNQSGTANGVELYAKRITMRNVLINNCKTIGLVTEGGYLPGQADWQDLPEGSIGPLWIRNCGSHGWRMRGPHDAIICQLGINECDGDGLRIESDGATYNGACDIVMAHIYANDGYGVYVNGCALKAEHLIAENNGKEGAYLDSNHNHIGMLETYTNCKVSGTFEVMLTANAAHTIIGSANIRGLYAAARSGIQVNCDFVQINNCSIDGSSAAATGIGLEMVSTADFCSINAKINGFTGVGGVGLKTNSGGAGSYNQINARLYNCATCWNNAAVGAFNGYQIRGYAEAGQTFFSGSGPNATDSRERWDVAGLDAAGTSWLSEIRKTSGSTVDLNSTAEQVKSIACTELMGLTPEFEDVTVALYSNGANTTWEVQYLKVIAVSAASIDFAFKCSVAAGVAQTGNLLVTVRL